MAKLGEIFLGGREPELTGSEQFLSGIGFPLNVEPEIDCVWESQDSNWQVELKKKQLYAVAKSRIIQDYDNLVVNGLEQIQRCLDIVVAKKLGLIAVDHPEASHIAVFTEGNHTILRHHAIHKLGMSANCTVVVRDKDGNIKPQPPIPEPRWTSAFRYYRLSQTSQDIYEAYRNLYLCFEATLNEICSRLPREREGTWLKRALADAGTKVNLQAYTPSGQNPIDYLFQTQYEGMRCKLFHAKFPEAILPLGQVNPADVLNAYSILVRLWREVAQIYFQLPRGGGVVTYQGFKLLMDNAFKQPLSMYVTEDDSPAQNDDTQISPRGLSTFQFESENYLSETKPGVVSYQGETCLTHVHTIFIHRICTLLNNKLMFVDYIRDGLLSSGVDVFQSFQSVILVNSGQPKTTF
jgi:hypothetical protein